MQFIVYYSHSGVRKRVLMPHFAHLPMAKFEMTRVYSITYAAMVIVERGLGPSQLRGMKYLPLPQRIAGSGYEIKKTPHVIFRKFFQILLILQYGFTEFVQTVTC